jgi:hypothetical protein
MSASSSQVWSTLLRQTLGRYDETLLRRVAGRLLRPRNQWPVEELIERCLAATDNAPVIDRRLQELDADSRRVLAAIGLSRQPRWRLGNLVELALALGATDGLKPLFALFEAGFLYPLWSGKGDRTRDFRGPVPFSGPNREIHSFKAWVAQSAGGSWVFTPPLVAERARGEDLGIRDFPQGVKAAGPVMEADGLEWPLRLAVAWQEVVGAPLRRTQQGDFFKRDAERLGQDALLNTPAAEALATLPQPAYLAVALAETQGIMQSAEGELRAGELPQMWESGLLPTLESLWAALPLVQDWDALQGWRSPETAGNPFPSAYLLAFLLLARLPEDEWTRLADLENWVVVHHPLWNISGKSEIRNPKSEVSNQPISDFGFRISDFCSAFLLGLAQQLRFVQAAKGADGEWVVRLSRLGRWLVGLGEPPALETHFQQTLLVQPNLEIVAYRQGLTPALIARLTKFAQWKSLGAACILQLEPKSVYRALESGLSFEAVVQCLEQHGSRATPPTVIESLRTWADKRERLTVYPSAALLEFGSSEELNEALARGVPAVRLSDRLAVIADESAIDYRHFRLIGTRDYSLPPDKCVEVEDDGVTLAVDLARSDLLLETELPRFAERLERPGLNGRREYRLTPASLGASKSTGMTIAGLEAWFQQRTGQSLSPAARMLLIGSELPAPELRRHLVLHVATADLADGLMQWPETRALIEVRMGPTALAVAESNAATLRGRLAALGMTFLDNDQMTG